MRNVKWPSLPKLLPAGAQGAVRVEHFEITDTIGVPHPYCITPKHVTEAADHWGGRLGEEAIKATERKHGRSCGMRGCNLDYEEHEQALVVSCRAPLKGADGATNPELHQMLLANKDECEKNGYAGFAFVKAGAA